MATTKTEASGPEKWAQVSTQWAEDMKKLFEQYQLPGIDLEAIAEWQRQDMEALAEANRKAAEGLSNLTKRRGEILEEALSEWQAAMKDAGGTDAAAKQAEAMQEGFKQAMSNFRELTELEIQAHSNAWKVVQDRMHENMTNLQNLLTPKK